MYHSCTVIGTYTIAIFTGVLETAELGLVQGFSCVFLIYVQFVCVVFFWCIFSFVLSCQVSTWKDLSPKCPVIMCPAIHKNSTHSLVCSPTYIHVLLPAGEM